MAPRTPGRHSTGASRFTPRRWLPFLVMSAVVAAGVTMSGRHADPPTPPGAPTAGTEAILPAVARRDALASAWYCGGGTARGEAGAAELSLVIANDDGRGAMADISVYDDGGGATTRSVRVPANGRARVAASSIRDGDWVAATVEVRGGRVVVDREVRGPHGFDASPCSTRASARWYVPSGSTLRGAEEHLTLFNPFPDTASVSITYATDSGLRAPRLLQKYAVPGRSLRVVRVADTLADPRSQVAATVRARAGQVVVDRVQIYDGTGDPVAGEGADALTTAPPEGVVSTPGLPGAAARWLFPGTSLTEGIRSQVAVLNPSGRTAQVDVAVTYEDPKANPTSEPIQLSVPPREQVVLDLTEAPDVIVGLGFTIDVRSLDGVPVVAERLSFTGAPGKRRGAAVVAGSPIAATRWLVAQAGATEARSSGVLVANPGPRATKVRVVQLTGGTRSTVASATITVPAGDRRSVPLKGVSPAATLELTTAQPVVVSTALSDASGLGLSLAMAQPFPESVVALPPG